METFGTGQGFLKAGLLGFSKSGKTYTAALLAIELLHLCDDKRPIAFFDTEGGVEYIAPLIREATGQNPVGKKSRSLVDLLTLGRECEAGAAGALIVDSVTHPWREICDSYLDQVNKQRDALNKPRRQRLEFQDWAAIKARWSQWTDFYLNSQLHIIICGRAGYEWNFEEVEDTSGAIHKELRKTGIKMKVEGEFGFEPSLLVEMERVQVPLVDRPNHFSIIHRATVLGDRFNSMDGQTADNPTGAWFMPHLSQLVPGAANIIDTSLKTDMGVDEAGDAQFQRERRERTKLCEEIQGEITKAWPGQSAVEKRAKVECFEACCQTKSWTAVESFSLARLTAALAAIREYTSNRQAVAAGKE